MADRDEILRDLFDRLVELPDRERAAFLDAECAGDPDLRAELSTLIAHDAERPDQWLDPLRVAPDSALVDFDAGDLIDGRYTVRDKLGEGGAGIVYLAEQTEPVRREVAVKVIKLGMDTKQVIARFEAERQTLALMDHPSIARVYDGGATARGRPYFAMELVRGVPITTYADDHGLSTPERLLLFIDVCVAVHHAHQKGIIHRDLKPSNVLVTVLDERAVPKIIDFGIAKATHGRLGDQTYFTELRQFVGTPAYMSPEQARADAIDVDTRTDVYSLGVLLYELLTGSTPYDESTLRDKDHDELRRMVREVVPPRPSARISRLSADGGVETDVARLARARGTDARGLHRQLRGDLDWIVMRALEKDRTRRYDSASAFARDITRHLRNEPVIAGPPGFTYRAGKFIRRHRASLAVASLLLVLLVSFAAATFVQSEENRRLAKSEGEAKGRALAAAEAATIAHERAERHADDLTDALRTSKIEQGRLRALRGDTDAASSVLWREHLLRPDDPAGYWALWELYAHHPCRRTVAAHERSIRSVAVSADERVLVTGGFDDGLARLWRVPDLEPLGDLRCDGERIEAVSLSDDGRLVATATGSVIELWDTGTLEALHTFAPGGAINALAFADDGRLLIGAGGAGKLGVWRTDDGSVVAIPSATSAVSCLASSANGMLAAGCTDGSINLWRDLDAPPVAILRGHQDAVRSVIFAPDEATLVSGSTDRTIRIWDLAERTCTKVIEAKNGTVARMHYRRNGRSFVAAGSWRVEEWSADGNVQISSRACPGISVATLGDHDIFGGSTTDGALHHWSSAEDTGLLRLPQHEGRCSAVFSADGEMVATGDGVGAVRLWDSRSGTLVRAFEGHTARVRSVQFAPGGQLLASGSVDGTVRIWDVETGALRATLDDHINESAQGIAFDPRGTTLLTTSWSPSVSVRPAPSWSVGSSLATSTGRPAVAARFSPDGETIAISARGAVHLDLVSRTGEPIAELAPTVRQPWTIAFSDDGGRIATGTWNRAVEVWDTESCEHIATLAGHIGAVWGVAFRPDDPDLLASCSDDGTVRLWHVPTARNLAVLDAFGGHGAITIGFHRDASGADRLLVAGAGGHVVIWDFEAIAAHIEGNLAYQRSRLGEG